MTKARIVIMESLAARGHPEYWATEEEAAALSGVTPDRFREKVAEWEVKGFPKITPDNGKRFIPKILAYWQRESDRVALKPGTKPEQDEELAKEKFGNERPRKRLSA
jgi:hypothetical protein